MKARLLWYVIRMWNQEHPIYVESINGGLDRAREQTKGGILVINSAITSQYKTVSMTNNGWEIEEFNKVKSYLSLKNTGGYFDARWPNNFGKKFGFIARDGQFICLS